MDRTSRSLDRWLLVLAVVGLAGLLIGGWLHLTAFFHAYLVGYTFWLGVALGCLVWLMIHHLTGGHWGWALRQPAEVIISTMPWLTVGFIPVLLGLSHLYPWAQHQSGFVSEVLEHQREYLNLPWILVRAILYFVLWNGCAWALLRPPARVGHAQRAAAIGLVLMFLTITFAAIDWLLAVEAKAFSSIWGFYVGVGFAAVALGMLVWIVLWPIRHVKPEDLGKARTELLRDLGNLLLTCVVLHAYMSFSQFFITWNGNTKAEVLWYVTREQGFWGVLAVVLILIYFFLPFWALLFRFVKSHPPVLMGAGVLMLVAQALSLMWMVLPGMNNTGRWKLALATMGLSTLAILGLGGLFLLLVVHRWRVMTDPDRPRTALQLPREVIHETI
jgi:hypothetical protein